MGYQIIKCAPDEDLYMEWSSIVEAPTAAGTRTEMLDHLTEQRAQQPPVDVLDRANTPESRLHRADTRGTSMLDRSGCDWNSHSLIYMQRGYLPRSRFAEFARRFLADDEAGMAALLDPFDDEPEDTGAA